MKKLNINKYILNIVNLKKSGVLFLDRVDKQVVQVTYAFGFFFFLFLSLIKNTYLLNFFYVDLFFVFILSLFCFFELIQTLKKLNKSLKIRYSSFNWYKYVLFVSFFIALYFILSNIFLQLDSSIQHVLFVFVLFITGLNFTISDSKFGIYRFICNLFLCVLLNLLSLIPSFLLVSFILFISTNICILLYVQLLLILFYTVLIVIQKVDYILIILSMLILLQYKFIIKNLINFKISYALVLSISVMLHGLLLSNFFSLPTIALDYNIGVFDIITDFIHQIVLEQFQGSFLLSSNYPSHRVNIRHNGSNMYSFRKFLNTKIQLKGQSLQFKPLISSALTGYSTILVNTINEISVANPVLLKNFTQSLIQPKISKANVLFQFNNKIRSHRLLKSRLINAPLLLETEEDVYAVFLHLQEYYTTPHGLLEKTDNLFYLLYGKEGHKEIVSGFELWVYLNFLQGSIRTAMYESLLKTITFHRERTNTTLLRATMGQGMSGVAYFGDMVGFSNGSFTFYNYKFSSSMIEAGNNSSPIIIKNILYNIPEIRNFYIKRAIHHEISKLPYMRPEDKMQIIAFSQISRSYKVNTLTSRVSIEVLDPRAEVVNANKDVDKLRFLVKDEVKNLKGPANTIQYHSECTAIIAKTKYKKR